MNKKITFRLTDKEYYLLEKFAKEHCENNMSNAIREIIKFWYWSINTI